MVFEAYADLYDALYADKDYESESEFVTALFKKYSRRPVRRILDLGCGTGGHAVALAARGYEVVGVDRSEPMLRQARRKLPDADFHIGDVRSVRIDGGPYDAVIAMFAVVAYQTSGEDVEAMFRTARAHLAGGGLFVFDGWYGPAVLLDPPGDRVKRIGDLERRTRAVWHRDRQVVDVHFSVRDVVEVHPMRYLFPDEIRDRLDTAKLELVELSPFMNPGVEITERDWLFSATARA